MKGPLWIPTPTVRTETQDRVRSGILCRPERYNAINARFRDELSAAVDAVDADDEISAILLRADGRAFCAGYALDEYAQQGGQAPVGRVWDSMYDLRNISTFVSAFARLWYSSKPTIAAVQGRCIGGGTDSVFWADLILASERIVWIPTSTGLGRPGVKQLLGANDTPNAQHNVFTGGGLVIHF